MKKALLTWLGTADVNALKAEEQTNSGPLRQVISERGFDIVYIMSNREHDLTKQCVDILKKWNKRLQIEIYQYDFTDPTDYELVLKYTEETLVEILPKVEYTKGALTFFATPGTPIMVAVLLLMAERLPQVSLIQSTMENGIKHVKWSLPNYLTQEKIDKIATNSSATFPDFKTFENFVGSSDIMREKVNQALRYACLKYPVLLFGETGTGKEIFAKLIHEASHRSGNEPVAVNCGAIPSGLIESTLFGAKDGAFTGSKGRLKGKFEEADGGTIFLDEIGELPLEQQVKFLRVLNDYEITPVGEESKKVNVRVIAATNRNLPQMVRDGTFREDLYYRLRVAVITLPPLRERSQDILLAADLFLANANEEICKSKNEYKEFSTEAKLFISSQKWPGNFRELNSVIYAAVINSREKTLTVSDMQAAMMLDVGTTDKNTSSVFELPQYTSDGSFKLDDALKAVEKHYIELALRDANHKKTKAAQLLGIDNYQILTPRMKEYGL